MAIVALALFSWLAFTLLMVGLQLQGASERVALDQREQQVEATEQQVEAYRESVEDRIASVAERQRMLDALVERHFGNLELDEDDVEPGEAERIAAPEGEKGAALLARLEANQFAFARRLRAAVEEQTEETADAIREFGLDPRMLTRRAMGGPLRPVAARDSGIDEEIIELEVALNRLAVMELSLRAIPSARPTQFARMTSPFGIRSDPFNGGRAMHTGIDFRGSPGQGILATGGGRVVFAGRKGGYGNCVEIDHGSGVVTRYAHLSRIEVRPGQRVERGARIGGMGSTGRSTATHLHYEVRINGRAVNPRPLLEADSHVLEIQSLIAARRDRNAVERG
ncbi:MAG: M23 family metallopeptidase [Parasphingopyxis sp.]|nr:M23 family metallopeptidase [Sphingomonadales bacterium]